MRLRLGPNDEDAYCEARDELVGQFADWAEDLLLDVDPDGVISLLDYKWGQGDGELTYWTEPDLEDFLVIWYPRNVATAPEGHPPLIATLRSFVEFLDEQELFDDRSDPTDALLGTLEDVEAQAKPIEVARLEHLERMEREREVEAAGAGAGAGDESSDRGGEALSDLADGGGDHGDSEPEKGRHDDAGLLVVEGGHFSDLFDDVLRSRYWPGSDGEHDRAGRGRARDRGAATERAAEQRIELVIDGAMQHWLDLLEREQGAEGPTLADELLGQQSAPSLPLALPPSRVEVGKVAGEAPIVHWLDELARCCRDGWPLSPPTPLPVAEAEHTLAVARQLGIVRIDDDTITTEPGWSSPPPDPVELVQQAFAALVEIGPVRGQHPNVAPTSVVGVIDGFVDDGLPHVIAMLYGAGRPVPVAKVVEPIAAVAWDLIELPNDEDADSVHQRVLQAVDALVDVLERVAVVHRSLEAGTVSLTPCGHLIAPGLLTAAGYRIKFAGVLADKSALEALTSAAEMDEDDGLAELLVWVEQRLPSAAAAELAEAALDAGDPAVRILSMAALDFVADDAVDHVRAMLDSPLQGHAVVWLSHHGHAARVEVDPADPGATVDVLGAVLEAGGTEALHDTLAELGSAAEQQALLEAIWQTRHPATLPVLEAVSRTHTDVDTAKVARKAALRHRSWLASIA